MVLRNHYELTQRLHKQRERLAKSTLLRDAYLKAAHRNQYMSEQDRLYGRWNFFHAVMLRTLRNPDTQNAKLATAYVLRNKDAFFAKNERNLAMLTRKPAGLL